MDLKAHAFSTQSEGPALDLASLAGGPGQILEVALRRIKDSAGLDTARKQFIDLPSKEDGVVESYELTVKGSTSMASRSA